MSKKRALRYDKTWYEEPTKPEDKEKRFRIEQVTSFGDRINHFPGASGEDHFYEYEDDEPESVPEYTGELDSSQSISLDKVINLLNKEGLDSKKVFFTASMSEDHLVLEIIHIKKMTAKETQEEYQDQLRSWKERQEEFKERERQSIQWQLEALQQRANRLKK